MTEVASARPGVRDPSLETALRRLDAYRVERILAEKPGFSTELASHPLPDGSIEYVVLKHVAPEFANPGLWERYGTIRQGHLPRLIEVIALPNEFVIVLQFIQGESLADYVGRTGAMDVARARTVMDDLCDAAFALAEVGIVHRDVKPSNVILAFDGAYLIDPGIARLASDGAVGGARDHDTTILGSWGYAAPEQLGYAPTDARSDVFSLGRVLGYMLTGLSPTDPDYSEALRTARTVPEGLRRVVLRTCALEPSLRPVDAKELRQLVDTESQVRREPVPRPRAETRDDGLRPPAPMPTSRSTALPGTQPARKPASHRAAIALTAAFAGFFGILFCLSGFFIDGTSMPRWGYVLYGFAMGVLGNFLPGCEIVQALRGTGTYAIAPSRRKTCMRRILIEWALCFGILILVMAIVRTTGWQQPR